MRKVLLKSGLDPGLERRSSSKSMQQVSICTKPWMMGRIQWLDKSLCTTKDCLFFSERQPGWQIQHMHCIYIIIIYGAPSHMSPERLQRHKDMFITHTHTHTQQMHALLVIQFMEEKSVLRNCALKETYLASCCAVSFSRSLEERCLKDLMPNIHRIIFCTECS